MAGHSKWANIKFRKAAQDKKRGKIFTKLIREITISAKQGGGDPDNNSRLRLAIDKALSHNMPRDTVERARKRGAGDLDASSVEEIRYEGYGPSGVAVMVECMTDNRNRTVAEVRHIFTKCGGNLGTDGSVAYLFTKQGIIRFAEAVSEDKVLEVALEAGADDVITNDDGSIEVQTSPEQYSAVKTALDNAGLVSELSEVTMIASNEVSVDKDSAEKILKMLDLLEDLDDVQDVFSNADIPDDVLTSI